MRVISDAFLRSAVAPCLLVGVALVCAPGRALGQSIWDGVYSEAQAARGEATFAAKCEACHGKELAGISFNGPELKGARFFGGWGDDYLDSLFEKVKTQMPKTDPSTATDEEKLAVIAYVLRSNGYPAGAAELTANELDGIRIEHPADPPPIEDNTLVRVVGCLTSDPDVDWILTRSTEPRLSNEKPSTPQQLKDAAATQLGTRTFRLLDADLLGADGQDGHKIDGRGILIRTTKEERVNLVTLQSVGSSCQ